jgi:hypothetical protein
MIFIGTEAVSPPDFENRALSGKPPWIQLTIQLNIVGEPGLG